MPAESRILPVYKLMIGKAGLKMREVEPSKFIDEILRSPRFLRGHFTMPGPAYLLTVTLDRRVLDSTGLKAIYNIDLQWTPNEVRVSVGHRGWSAATPAGYTTDLCVHLRKERSCVSFPPAHLLHAGGLRRLRADA